MDLLEILQSLKALHVQFTTYNNNWTELKQKREFMYEISHSSPIRDMYAEGVSCAHYLKGSLDTSHVNKEILIHEYVENVKKAIPPEQHYYFIWEGAQQDFKINYPDNYTVQYMLKLYLEQWNTVKIVENLISALTEKPSYQISIDLTPIDVIRNYVSCWEENSQLHKGLGENSLRSQLVLELQRAGFSASSETHAFQGHADIVVANSPCLVNSKSGHQLIAECKIWRGPASLDKALSQLCLYVTQNTKHAAMIIFVNEGLFSDICEKSKGCLSKHTSCSSYSVESKDCIRYSLVPAQDHLSEIPATLLLCNLTTPRY